MTLRAGSDQVCSLEKVAPPDANIMPQFEAIGKWVLIKSVADR
jgi:hypothetical protein